MSEKSINVTSPAPQSVWQDLVDADPEALPYQTPVWFKCICAAGGYQDVSRLYELPGGRQLVLPMVRSKKLLSMMTFDESPPHGWGMGGVIAADAVTPDDISIVFADLAKRSALRTSIRPNPRCGEAWAAAQHRGAKATPRLAHVLDLSGGFDVVWSERFASRTRTYIRRAERDGTIDIECDTTGKLVPVFYDLLLQSFDRWAEQQNEPRWLAHWRGNQRDPMSKFQIIADSLGDACRIWVARIDGKPAAAALILQGANVNYARGAMDKELVGSSGVNYLLQRLAIEDACKSGCRYYHFGESGASSGMAQYKSRFGAEPYEYSQYYLERVPISTVDAKLRGVVKYAIGFRDV